MKKIVLFLLVICCSVSLAGCNSGKDDGQNSIENLLVVESGIEDMGKYYGDTFGQGEVIDINVNISEDNWEDILSNPTSEEYHTADITVNGTTVDNIGIRTKGFSSLTSVAQSESDRYGFKVKIDKYVKNQTLNGLNEFVLNANFADPSYMREYLTYSAMNYLDGITPFVTYTNLYINGELFGFYLCVEAYDDSFIERYSSMADTNLYKAQSDYCTLTTSDDLSGFELQYGEDSNLDNIKSLIQVLNNATEENKNKLESILDIDSVLKAVAVNTVMGNYDSYNGSKAHNYYLMYSNGKFSYIGWDYNMSIGGFNEDNGASVTVDINSPVYNVDISERPLIEKLLAIDEYKTKYLEYINTLCEYFSDFEDKVEGISNQISTYVENDPSSFYTFDKYKDNIVASDADLTQVTGKIPGPGGGRPGQMKINSDGTMTLTEGEGVLEEDAVNGATQNIPDGVADGTETPMDRPDLHDGVQIPEGMEPPNAKDMPEMPQGENIEKTFEGQQGMKRPDMNSDNMQQGKPNGGGMGGMISNNAVSIIDYITQRIEQIKIQLS